MKKVNKKDIIIIVIIILIAILVSMKSSISIVNNCASRDVSVWVNAAAKMKQGEIIYRDVFDHKGPLLYFIYFLRICFKW